VTLNRVDVNCSPQARFSLPSPRFAATLAVARTKNTAYRPAQYQRFIWNTSRRALPDCWANDISLSPSTGSTQGMRFRINPPARPISSAIGREIAAGADAAAAKGTGAWEMLGPAGPVFGRSISAEARAASA